MTMRKSLKGSQPNHSIKTSGLTSPFEIDENTVAVNFFVNPADKAWIESRAAEWKVSQSKILRWCLQCGQKEYERALKKQK